MPDRGAVSRAKERHPKMTMFSMKPKFDLAEFLAVPAPAGAARRRNTGGRGMQFRKTEEPVAAAEPAAAKEPKTADTKK